ncbi:flagellar biosynthesis protein FlhB [Veronia pacifica]|uniref:Flagellar biosynthesis protein FlhB n=2 Tax=Veronia pacifica TaxID=1080227 RepID=A0A1C3EEJ5_9GAMM|nr:EscU/YscU/HrcU family type III secretion system export apparatus switch protein [Veronia pacifica]ODA31655.1 flagellar biosynthesis protein FlhB [Veronia pacifica]
MGSQDPKQTRSQQGVQKIKAAVALHYDGQGAPSVAAKGFDHRAEQLIEDMKREGKLIHEDHELVRWLQNMEVGETIPENLYIVIAELIAFAWYLDGKNPPQWEGKVLNKKV